jgi:O-antigen ligase
MAAIGVLALAGAAAFAASHWPARALAGGLVVAVAALAVARLPVAVSLLVASFYFDAYLAVGVGILTAGKLIGVLALAAWFVSWALTGRRLVTDALFWPLAGLAAWLPLSLAGAYDPHAGTIVALRYLTFFALVFLVVQTVGGDRRAAVRIVDAAVAAGAAAALVGLASFAAGAERAYGPINDPNDYAFMLAVTVPLALYRVRWAPSRPYRALATLALLAIVAAILTTLSRSAVTGLAAAGVWAICTRRVPLRWVAVALGGALTVGLALYLWMPQLVALALLLKEHAAQGNVDLRLLAWRVALREAGSSPVLGVGPGNFEVRFDEFSLPPVAGEGPLAVHNAYLSVLAELGVPGLAMFLAWLALGWARLRRRVPGDPEADALQGALAGGFVVAAVGALFLTQQFYSPLWLLPALGATLAAGGRVVGRHHAPRPGQAG